MADNVTLNSGSGGVDAATDEIAGAHYQRVKVIIGADGTNDGDVASGNPMPVSGTVDLGAVDNAVLDAIAASVAAIDSGQLADGHNVTIDNVSIAITAAALPLPTGAATAANQSTANTALSAIQTAVELADDPVATISATPLQRVAIFDDSDGQITSFGGGTEYVEDAVAPANPTGKATSLVREDTPASQGVDGDWVAQRGTQFGAAYAQIVDSSGNFIDTFGGSGGTSATDDGAFVAGTGTGTPAMGFFSTDTVNANDVGVLAMDASRRLLVSIEADNAGIGGGTQYTEDDVVPANPVGTATLAQRDDALGGLTPIEGDWSHLFVDANGALWTRINGTVTVDGSGVTQPVSGMVTANLSATDNAVLDNIQTAVEIIDNAISGTEMQVDVVTSALPTGASTAANQSTIIGHVDGIETVLGTIDTDTGNIAAAMAAEGAALGSGVLLQGDDGTDRKNINVDATTGDVQVDITHTVNVDGSGVTQPVSAASMPLPTGAATAANQLPDGHNVTIDNASGASAVNIQDGGNSITIDGSVTADLGANNDVTIDASSIVHAEDTAHSTGHDGVAILGVRNDDLAALAGADGDYAMPQFTQNGAMYVCNSANDDYKYAVIDDASSGNNTLVAAVASRKIRVLALFMVAGGDVDVRFEDGASGTALTGQMDLTTNSGFSLPYNPAGWFETSVNTLLNLELSGAVSVDGSLTYIEVP